MITIIVTFEDQRMPISGQLFAIMRKTYKLFGFKVWETVERANF